MVEVVAHGLSTLFVGLTMSTAVGCLVLPLLITVPVGLIGGVRSLHDRTLRRRLVWILGAGFVLGLGVCLATSNPGITITVVAHILSVLLGSYFSLLRHTLQRMHLFRAARQSRFVAWCWWGYFAWLISAVIWSTTIPRGTDGGLLCSIALGAAMITATLGMLLAILSQLNHRMYAIADPQRTTQL